MIMQRGTLIVVWKFFMLVTKMKKSLWVVLFPLLVILAMTSSIASAAVKGSSVEERLNKLERLINSNGLVDIMVRLESIQSELQRLHGELEVQKHTLDEIKKRQRDLYLDIDRRVLQIERRSGSVNTIVPVMPETSDTTVSNINAPQTPAETETAIKQTKSNTVPAPVPAKSGNEQAAYQKAFDLLRALRYDKATIAFRNFLASYPNGRYAHIAQYWLAETSYHTRKYEIAVRDYQALINNHPKSPKRADALLKIGYSQFELKAFTKSRKILEKLIKSYPGTTEAGQAQNLLQKIRLKKVQ